MNYNSFPLQRLPQSQKTKEWKELCVKWIVQQAEAETFGSDRVSRRDMKAFYDLYNSVYDEQRLKYVTNPFKQTDGFPATAQNINIIKPQIDLLLGEESKRPFNFTVIRTSDTVTTEIQDKMRTQLTDYIMASITANMGEEEALIYQEQLQSGEIQLPEDIASYFNKSYKDVAESVAHKSLQYFRHYLNLDKVFLDGWKDAVISSEEIYYVGDRNNKPYAERVNPLQFAYESSPDLDYIHDASWCVRKLTISHQELYDRFYEKLGKGTLEQILAIVQSGSAYNNSDTHVITRYREMVNGFVGSTSNDPSLINVWHACWKSYKKIGFVTIMNEETETPEEFQVDESYYVTGEELNIEWDWILETWEGYHVADDIFFGIEPLDYQYVSSNNLNSQRLPYTGAIYSNTNTSPKSFVSFLEPLQYIYIMLWYRLELSLARDKGKVLTMDITQIPKSYDIDVAKWMHMLSALGINLVNPYDEGWDVPGRQGGKASNFNQISSTDLSMSSTIAQYVQLLDKVEQMAGSLTGITPQRQGAIASRELVGNVERSIIQSSNITESMFWKHNNVKREVLSMLLNVAKNIWANNNPTSIHYVLEDGERMFLDINEDFLNEDFDLFITDATEEMHKLNQLESLYQPAMQNGAQLSDIAEIMTIKNITKIKEKLREIEDERAEREQQSIQQQQDAQMQIAEMERQTEELKIQDNAADRELAKYKIDQDNITKVNVATIGAYKYQEDLDVNNDNIPDPIQIGELALKQQDADARKYDTEVSRSLKREELATKKKIEQDKIKGQKELQAQKDKAALAREELKARTAIRNKVSGEK